MPPVRVLIVDDSVVVRKVVCDALAACPEIAVAGTAASGAIGLAKISQLAPDVVTLDIEMPGMNGIETLVEIRKLYPRLPVIMFSTLTERGAAVTLEALSLGASDYATKPSNTASLATAIDEVRRELVEKILSLVRPAAPAATSAVAAAPLPPLPIKAKSGAQRIDIVAIGSSTGGPNALAEVVPHLPEGFPLPVVIVQHMPPVFTHLLAERLNSRSPLAVREAEAGSALAPGQVWIARGGYHMVVVRKGAGVLLALHEGPPENSCRPAVDVLFRSVAEVYGPNVLGVVMTGMGSDGALGARQIRAAGGEILVQDEASSVVWGMPGAVVGAGAASKICPLPELSQEILRRVAASRPQKTNAARSS